MTNIAAKLDRGLSLTQATSINMIDMVGIGPFVTIPFIVGAMQGPQCVLAWLLGALLAFLDGSVWSELGARWPKAGGSYVFLQNIYGNSKFGKMMSFLLVWQTIIQAPLVVASAAIGFSQYLTYLVTLTAIQQKMVSGALVILVTVLLYRNIRSIGKISVLLWIITGGTFLWLIGSGFRNFNPHWAFSYSSDAFNLTPIFFIGLGQATLKTVYSYLGYYNVCHLGGEIKNPEKNIPRSIFISVAGIAVLYLGMQIMILGAMPWQKIAGSSFVISAYFEQLYNPFVGKIATLLILIIAASSLFAVMLGYSRIPYAAATDGNFFKIFSKVHPTKQFPYVSLLFLGGIGFVFSLLFKMKEVITAIITMRIIVQFVGQSVGVLYWHWHKPTDERPYKMWLFPLPAVIGIIIWLFILFSSPWVYIAGAAGIILLGVVVYTTVLLPQKEKQAAIVN
ncbi:amino acid/polyamine/organocation transporter (APC superfamily) [Mucilaginibacter gracilis]|uniref:Amino acid/polyamine/organocation transporter (APC superfamily) n=1 Tax=Mucilaginibacter gracilis TaxID=423350 RepID=A0A495IZ87_9SPHI|nr:amino acid permease [Mucilaginibacter gracilis]RKR81408.1 amino acid/polyamine/organocation transporter (APC superfamily) [Mucilaginibacter gracilis]